MTLFDYMTESPAWTLLYLCVIGLVLLGVAREIGDARKAGRRP